MTKKQFVEQLDQLIRLKTLTGDVEENKRGLDLIESWISNKALIERQTHGGKELLLASNKAKRPEVGYIVHLDVVAGSDELFEMKRKGDKVFGRGVCDMKFSIPIGVALLNELIESNSKLAFMLIVTTDEEEGGFDGARILAEKLKLSPELLIVPDGGDNFEFVYRSKGVAQILVEASGVAAHASEPWNGRNAIGELIRLGSILEREFGKNNLKPNWETTCNFGQIHGGSSTNQVCDAATMKLDFRLPETTDATKTLKRVQKIIVDNKILAKASLMVSGRAFATDVDDKNVRAFVTSMEKVIGRKIEKVSEYGSSDARFFPNSTILMIKPNGGEIHAIGEWISINSCLEYYQGVRDFLNYKLD